MALLEPGWDERYGRTVEACRLLSRKNASAQVLADQIGADGARLMAAIDADPTAGWMNDLAEVQVLRTVFDQQYTTTTAGRLRSKTVKELPPVG